MKRKLCRLFAVSVLITLVAGCTKTEPQAHYGSQYDSQYEESRYYMYVAAEGLNVRSLPDAGSTIVSVLYLNDKVMTDKVSHDGWYKIASLDESAEGYVNAKYLSDEPAPKPAPAPKTAPAPASKPEPEPDPEPEAIEPAHPVLSRSPKN